MSDVYRKSLDHVTVYIYDGGDLTRFKELFDKHGITYEALETKIPYQGKDYYKRSITFKQDGNTFVLSKGKYLVHDNLNTFTVYDEYRFKKLFDKIYTSGIY